MSTTRLIPAVLAASALFGAAACNKNMDGPVAAQSASAATSGAATAQADRASNPRYLGDDLPLLPAAVAMGVRPMAIMRATYEFSARHPEVMNHVPCFCGCERSGHKDNHDCFVATRDAANKVTMWDTHAIGCEICVDVAYQAMQLHNSGASVSAIRDAIDKKWAPYASGKTPTPMPKRGGVSND
jgi:hypothetical protein